MLAPAHRIAAAAAAAVVAALALPGGALGQGQARLAQGQAIVEAKCAGCHATGRTGASPRERAPPFRSLSARYPLASLAEALAEGISVGHSGMPEFRFQPDEIDAILSYIASVSPPS